jgi:hypothetical protein
MELSVFFTAWKMTVRCSSASFSNLLLTEGHIIAYHQRNQMMAGAAVSALSSRQNIDFVFVLQRFLHILKLCCQHCFSKKPSVWQLVVVYFLRMI